MPDREPLAPPPRRSPRERQADDVASDVALGGARPSAGELERGAREAQALPAAPASDAPVRSAVGARLGVDLAGVRIVPDSPAARAERSVAFARRGEVHLAPGAYRPDHRLGRALLAHELTHAAQLAGPQGGAAEHDRAHLAAAGAQADRGLNLHFCDGEKASSPAAPSATPAAPPVRSATPPAAGPTGASVRAAADPQIESYDQYDAVRRGLEEAQRGNALEFHRKRTRAVVEDLCRGALKLGAADQAARLADFDALLAGAPPKDPSGWRGRRDAFLAAIKPPVVKSLERSGMTAAQENQNVNWLQNVPAQVVQLLLDVATPGVPPAYLYACAVNEGLVDEYVRRQVTGAGVRLTAAQLASIAVTRGVSGFQALGLDRYFEEKTEARHPLTGYLPAGFDPTKVTEERNVNEKGATVRSARVADLKTGLQVQTAILARRMDLFLDAQRDLGYPAPAEEEKVFFGYVFYNSGSGEGRRTLAAHKPGSAQPRSLGDWITRGEYPNAQKVLRTYRFVLAAGLLKGF